MADTQYPGGTSELRFVEAYQESTLRKPQAAADSLLRALVTAGATDRLLLTGLIAEQLAEACRRLVAVHNALFDRRYPVARTLLGPLPGVPEWRGFVQRAATVEPEAMLRDLGLGEEALASAEKLRSMPDLGWVEQLVAAAGAANAMVFVPASEWRKGQPLLWVAGSSPEGEPLDTALGVQESDAAGLADLTADMCSIARGFLGAYLGYRQAAGRRE